MTNLNFGHGHVYPRPDGARAKCGGPLICAECAKDQARKNQEERVQGRAQKEFPCIESTYDFVFVNYTIRIWRDVESLEQAETDDYLDVHDALVAREDTDWDAAAIVRALAKLPRVNAVQVKTNVGDVGRGIVGYVNWP